MMAAVDSLMKSLKKFNAIGEIMAKCCDVSKDKAQINRLVSSAFGLSILPHLDTITRQQDEFLSLMLQKSVTLSLEEVNCDQCSSKAVLDEEFKQYATKCYCHGRLICDQSATYEDYMSQDEIKRHVEAHDMVKVFICQQCSFKTDKRESFKSHIDTIHSQMKPLFCERYSYKPIRDQGLLQKSLRVSLKKLRELICPQCGHAFSYQWMLKRHIERQHEMDVPKCKTHEFKTVTQEQLTTHILTEHVSNAAHGDMNKSQIDAVHKKEKNFSCKLCDFRTAIKWRLQRHLKSVHEEIKDFACDKCYYKFACKFNLERHIQNVHGIEHKMEKK